MINLQEIRTENLLKLPSEENGGLKTDLLVEDETGEQISEEDKFIRCAQCLYAIAKPENRIVVGGSHQHTFANPHGILFEIACFSLADGCGYLGTGTEEFTWFKGYAWRIAVCRKCLFHLGWRYNLLSGSDSFYGLIVDHLVYPE